MFYVGLLMSVCVCGDLVFMLNRLVCIVFVLVWLVVFIVSGIDVISCVWFGFSELNVLVWISVLIVWWLMMCWLICL